VQLRDASVPEIVFRNSHDGTSAYQLRMGVFRVVCLYGLIVPQGAFPAYRVSHRGDAVDEGISGTLEVSERFGGLAAQVERMERRLMPQDKQIRFAERALAVCASQRPLGATCSPPSSRTCHGFRTPETTSGASSTASRRSSSPAFSAAGRRAAG
jgi:hypothetical protein